MFSDCFWRKLRICSRLVTTVVIVEKGLPNAAGQTQNKTQQHTHTKPLSCFWLLSVGFIEIMFCDFILILKKLHF